MKKWILVCSNYTCSCSSLNKLLHEYGRTGIRKQLQTLWTEWVEKNYGDKQQAPAITASHEMDAATPPDSDDADESSADTAGGGGSGGGGSGDPAFCWLTGNRLVDMQQPVPDPGRPPGV